MIKLKQEKMRDFCEYSKAVAKQTQMKKIGIRRFKQKQVRGSHNLEFAE